MSSIDEAVKYASANSAIEDMEPTKQELEEIKKQLIKKKEEPKEKKDDKTK